MPIPSGNLVTDLDLSNASCFSGSGLTLNDLSSSNNDFYFSGTGYSYTTVTGGEVTYNSFDTVLFRPTTLFNTYTFGTSAFSFNVWCKLNALGGLTISQIACPNFTGGAGSFNNFYLYTDDRFAIDNELRMGDNGGTETALGPTIDIGDWNLYSVVKPAGVGMSGVQAYLNGTLLTNPSTSTTAINLIQSDVGGQPQNRMGVAGSAHTNQGLFNGTWTLGAFQFYDVAIGSSDISEYYNATSSRFIPLVETFKIDAADPASYSGSGTTVYDLSPAARVGNLDTVSGGSSTWSPSFGGMFTLDGLNDIFEFPGGGVAVSQPGSISVWFRSDDVFNGGNVVSQGAYGDNGWGLNLSGAYGANYNTLHLVSHGVGYRNSGVGVTVGEWVFATLNYNNDSTSSLFINGGLGATMSAIGINPPQQLIRIGYDGGGVNTPVIDVAQVYMYGQALTLQDHIDLYDATKSPFVPPGPIATQNSNVGGRSFNKGLNG
jgi:hypothetical protein